MADRPYEIGDLVRLKAYFTDAETGSPVTPSSQAVRVKLPNSTVATFLAGGASSPTPIASGSFKLDFLVTSIGSHQVRWEASGPPVAEEFALQTVATTRFP